MARSFNGSSQSLRNTSLAIGASAHTIAAWATMASDAADARQVISLDHDSSNRLSMLGLDMASSGNPARLFIQNSAGTTGQCLSTTGISSTGVWFHIAGTCTALPNPTIQVFLNGGSKSSASPTLANDGGPQSVTVGARKFSGSLGRYWPGNIAHAAVWNVVLSDDEIAMLAAGYTPMQVRQQSLVAYWPMAGRAGASGSEEDWVGSYSLTHANSPGLVDEPRIIYPRRRSDIWVPQATATVPTITALSAINITATSAQPQITYA